MYMKLLNNHVDIVKNIKHENIILSYKGFPNYFLFELDKTFPFLNDKHLIFSNGLIDLKKILNNGRHIVTNILNKNDGVNIISYEELFYAKSLIDLNLFN